ncbi:hypothetical protein SAMN04515656_11223 [Eubacterium aggregans]|uniref:Uncharacterized protein n=1 Tax=Eubacterium aggregans TaxID=81409 RepID=A0A1H4BPD5_9FIRM|nr:hypothetical protein SAMN04515656_11223 [Eubacterium aggregans]
MILIQVESPEFCKNDCPFFGMEQWDVTMVNGKETYRRCENAALCEYIKKLVEGKHESV